MDMKRPITCNAQAVFRKEADGALLFNAENGSLMCLNEMGCEVWNLFDGQRSGDHIVSILSEEFEDVDVKEIRGDLLAFFEQLESRGFITTAP